jgi:hypothetical protein
MNWYLKCAAFYVFGVLPTHVYRAAQKRITRSYLLTLTPELLDVHQFHVENYRRLVSPGPVLEIGCGTNLLLSLLLSAEGAPTVWATDVQRIATVEQVNHVIDQLEKSRPGPWRRVADLGPDLFAKYRIKYDAPLAGHARFSGHIDFICSTSVLEHVPCEQLGPLLREHDRIGSPHVLMSHVIGYTDHFAHADKNISHFNFYRFGDRLWPLFNPAMQHQNRLRHSDFEKLFAERGFEMLERRTIPSTDQRPVPLHERFRGYSNDDLYAHDGLFLLSRPDTSQSPIGERATPGKTA